MNSDKIKRFIWNAYYVLINLILLVAGVLIMFITVAGSFDKKFLSNSIYINSISLWAIGLSIPGVIWQLHQMFFSPGKKFIMKSKCPNCKNYIEIELKEEKQ